MAIWFWLAVVIDFRGSVNCKTMNIFDFLIHIDKYLGGIIESYGLLTYGIIFLIIFAETGLVLTPFLPGDSLLFAVGMFAASGSFDVWLIFALIACASFLGDNSNYWIGRHLGKRIIENKRIPVNQNHIDLTRDFFVKHGKKTVVLARFMPIVRTFAPFVAGIGKMEYAEFLTFSFIGGIVWASVFVFAGYLFGNIPIVKDNFSTVIMLIILVSILPAAIKAIKIKIAKS